MILKLIEIIIFCRVMIPHQDKAPNNFDIKQLDFFEFKLNRRGRNSRLFPEVLPNRRMKSTKDGIEARTNSLAH